jgi:hypothetical protein
MINTVGEYMCRIQIKRTNNGTAPATLPRGELAFDYFTKTLFVGNASNLGVPIGREIYGETGADLFLEAYDEAWPTQESSKEYIDSIVGQYQFESKVIEYLGITANRQLVSSSTVTDTVIDWTNSTIYEETENVGIKIYDITDIWQDYTGFFQTEEDIMYVRVSYSLLLSDIGQSGTDGYSTASRFCAIKLLDKQDPTNSSTMYYGAQKVPPSLSNSAISAVRLPTMVSGTAIVPLPRRTANNSWEIQIVTRWITNGSFGNLYVGGVNDPNAYDVPIDEGNGINVQLQRLVT